MMVEAREMPESAATTPPPFVVPERHKARRLLTAEERAAFSRDGYVVLRGMFNTDEIDMLRACLEADPLIRSPSGHNISVPDVDGRQTQLTLWWNFGDDSYGQLARGVSLVSIASELMGGVEPYCSHTKILLKEPRTGGAWEWHQDFGYWYNQGVSQPDGILSVVVALDENSRENGAMRVLSRSHTLGRLEHGMYGGQVGADPQRVLSAMRTPGFDVRTLLLQPGDVAVTHSNLLHCSRPNLSDRWRRNLILAYNSRWNEPLPVQPPIQPAYTPIDVVPDEALLSLGCISLSTSRNDFLGQEDSDSSIATSPEV